MRDLAVHRPLLLISLGVGGLGLGYFLLSRPSREPVPQLAQEARREIAPEVRERGPAPPESAANREVASPKSSRETASKLPQARAVDEPHVLDGRVVNDLNEPVTRFEIAVDKPDRLRIRGGSEVPGKPFESPDGTFHLKDLRDGQWELTARASAHLKSAPVLVHVPAPESEVTLILPRPGELSGVVVNPNGTPIAEARIHLWCAGEYEPDFFEPEGEPEAQARTGPDGRFRIEGVQPADLFLLARHPEYSESDRVQLTLTPGASLDGVSITLDQGGRIEGVVDASQGEVTGRVVDLYSTRGVVGWRSTKTDLFGRFVIEHVIPQDYVAELKPSRYPEPSGDHDAQARPSIRKHISVKNGRTTELVFGGPVRTIRVYGRITARGKPMPDLRVQANPPSGKGDAGRESITDPDGRYSLGVDGAGEYRIQVSGNYGSYAWFDRTVPDVDEVEISLEGPSGEISGRVLGFSGEGLRGVPISAMRTGEIDRASPWKSYRWMYTEEDGSFAFRLLVPGSYVLRAPDGSQRDRPAPRVEFGRLVLTDLVVDESAVLPPLEIHLPPECRISGQVVDAKGNAVAGVWVRANNAGGVSLSAQWETQTNATGNFLIENVAPGTYVILVRGDPLPAQSAPVVVDAAEIANVRIQLP